MSCYATLTEVSPWTLTSDWKIIAPHGEALGLQCKVGGKTLLGTGKFPGSWGHEYRDNISKDKTSKINK